MPHVAMLYTSMMFIVYACTEVFPLFLPLQWPGQMQLAPDSEA